MVFVAGLLFLGVGGGALAQTPHLEAARKTPPPLGTTTTAITPAAAGLDLPTLIELTLPPPRARGGFVAAGIATWYYATDLRAVLAWTIGVTLATALCIAALLRWTMKP